MTRPPWTRAIERTIASPRPVPGTVTRARLVGAVKLVENTRQLVFGDSWPAIGDLEPRLVAVAPNAHVDPALLGELDGIIDQVRRRAAAAASDRLGPIGVRVVRKLKVEVLRRARAAALAGPTSLATCASTITAPSECCHPESALASVSIPLTMFASVQLLLRCIQTLPSG